MLEWVPVARSGPAAAPARPLPRTAMSSTDGPEWAAEASAEVQLAALFAEYSGALHTYAYHLLGSQEDADDVTQEVFIRVYAHLGEVRDQTRLRAWLYRIATNQCMDLLRRRGRQRRLHGIRIALLPDPSEDGPSREPAHAEDETAAVAERDHISRALHRMPAKYATCLLLHSAQGLSYREVAEVLGITPGAAAVRLSRARDLFTRHYDELRREVPE